MKKLPRVFLKAALIAAILIGVFAAVGLKRLGGWSLYNRLWRGRDRFPFGENPAAAYNFSLSNLDALFAAHALSGAPARRPNELRVVVIGDSSVWGTLLRPEETLAARLDGKTIHVDGVELTLDVYNLGYPTLSLSKDALILNRALAYEPDLVIWSMTFESFPIDKQLTTALVADNIAEFRAIAQTVPLPSLENEFARTAAPVFSLNRIRRELFDLIRLQLYGFLWSATGVDQDYPDDYLRPRTDFDADDTFHGVSGEYPLDRQAWDVLDAAAALAGETPILFLNEPMVVSSGSNSKIRYNFYYSRIAYDAWRSRWNENCIEKGWFCVDAWDALPVERFTNSAIHYDGIGAIELSQVIIKRLPGFIDPRRPSGKDTGTAADFR